LQILFNETEKLLEKWKHPDPYRPPTAPGGKPAVCQWTELLQVADNRTSGSKYERNLPAPDLPPPSREFVKRL
jgi:NADH dehydrogenase (ubiquinone) 1 beta subcomplex subunit 9